MKQQIIIIPSKMMGNNRKKDRAEDQLFRLSAYARRSLNIAQEEDTLLYVGNGSHRIRLQTFRAFSEDLSILSKVGLTDELKKKAVFVSETTFNTLYNGAEHKLLSCSKGGIFLTYGEGYLTDEPEHSLIGADPEFLIYDVNGNIIPATNVLSYAGAMGVDGNGYLGELRPVPSRDPIELVKNIRSILTNTTYQSVVKNFSLRSACYVKSPARNLAVGGHIHIGNPSEDKFSKDDKNTYLFPVMNKILDELIAIPMLCLDGMEKSKDRRIRAGYGRFGDYRIATDSSPRIEYRTLSGMWLIHPVIAKAVISITKQVVRNIWDRVIQEKFDKTLLSDPNSNAMTDRLWKDKTYEGWKNIPICKEMGCILPTRYLVDILNGDLPADEAVYKKWLSKIKKITFNEDISDEINILNEITKLNSEELNNLDYTLQKTWLEDKKFIIE